MTGVRSWTWGDRTAYAVGLLATDGCVLRRRPITLFTSKDEELVRLLLEALGLRKTIYRKPSGFGAWTYQTEIYDAGLHEWLMSSGIMPNKSLTLGAIDVPDAYFWPLVRGLLDGDGSVMCYSHAPNRSRYPRHRYTRLTTRFYSASTAHLEWLAARLHALGAHGSMSIDARSSRLHPLFRLQFSKRASQCILHEIYRGATPFALSRKRAVWLAFRERDAAEPPRRYRSHA